VTNNKPLIGQLNAVPWSLYAVIKTDLSDQSQVRCVLNYTFSIANSNEYIVSTRQRQSPTRSTNGPVGSENVWEGISENDAQFNITNIYRQL